jgi:hypothetical protein
MLGSPRGAAVLAALALLGLAGQAGGEAQEADGVDEGGGVLYLTHEALPSKSDDTCPHQPRYEMTLNQSRVEEGSAGTATFTTHAKSCPTRFIYAATTAFELNGTVRVVLNLRCDTVTQPSSEAIGSLDLYLVNDPNFNPVDPVGMVLGLNDDDISTDTGRVRVPSDCGSEPVMVVADLLVPSMEIVPGATLTLMVLTYYASLSEEAGPRVWIETGGADPSRIEAPAIPAVDVVATPLAAPPRVLLSAQPSASPRAPGGAGDLFGADCDGADLPGQPPRPVYAMVPEGTQLQDGTVPMAASTAGNAGCYTHFDYTATSTFTLQGPISVQLWFRCEAPTVGSPNDFEIQFRRLPAGSYSGEQFASPSRTGDVGGLEVCPEAAVQAPLAGSVVLKPVVFTPGDRLLLQVAPFYMTPPSPVARQGLEQVVVLVGPSTPSYLSVAGFPWASTLAVGNGTVASGEGVEPGAAGTAGGPDGGSAGVPGLGALAVFGAVLAAARSRWRR